MKVKPKVRLHTKTKVRVQLKRRQGLIEPPPVEPERPLQVLLPQLLPCDVILEYKQFHLPQSELEELLPKDAKPCPLKLAGQKLELALGTATATTRKEGTWTALNVGCHVGAAAWSPCGHVLALSVHSRQQPALGAEGPVTGQAALQLWRTQGTPQLRLGLVHQGGLARSLQWLPSKATKERLGLLLAVLGDGTLCIYSLPEAAFGLRSLSRQLLFAQFRPAWTAEVAPQGFEPRAMWQRHLQCGAARGSGSGALVAAGCERSVVLLWRLKGKGPLETVPCEVLKPQLQESDSVVSVAWCPTEAELLVAGLSTGYLILWDPAVPVMPLRSVCPSSRLPMVNLSWVNSCTVACPSECVSIDMRHERMNQFRPHRGGTSGKHLVRCTGMCVTPTAVLSSWSDGVVNMKSKDVLDVVKKRRLGIDVNWQYWSFSGKQNLDVAPVPPREDECPKDEAGRKEYIQKLFTEYEQEILNHQRLWEFKKCQLEIGTEKDETATPVPLSCVAVTEVDGSVVLATGSSSGIVSLMYVKDT